MTRTNSDLHHLRDHQIVQLLGLIDAAVADARISAQVHVDQLALVAFRGSNFPAKSVELIKVERVLDIPRDVVRNRRVEKHDEADWDVVFFEPLGELEQDIRAERMTDQDNRSVMPLFSVFDDPVGDREPAIVIVDHCLEPHERQTLLERIHPEREHIEEASQQIDAGVRLDLGGCSLGRLSRCRL